MLVKKIQKGTFLIKFEFNCLVINLKEKITKTIIVCLIKYNNFNYILNKYDNFLLTSLLKNRFGFRTRCRTREAILVMRLLYESRLEFDEDVFF